MATEIIPHKINDWSKIEENDAFWGRINLLKPEDNFGIHEYNGNLWTSGMVGVGHLFDSKGKPIFDNGKEHILIVSSSYGMDPWAMLEKVMEDEEYESYLEELEIQNKYLYKIFYDQPLIRLSYENESKAELIYALSYINACYSLCKKGLKKSLIYTSENYTAKLRGKIDITKNMKFNTARGRSDKFYCKYVDFTEDNIENRILKAALLRCKKMLSNKNFENHVIMERIFFCQNVFRHIAVKNVNTSDFSAISVSGLYSYYKPVLGQAKSILGHQINSSGETSRSVRKSSYVIPYVINMETLFEFYARTILKESLSGEEYKLNSYSERLYLQKSIRRSEDAEKGIHLMPYCIPDIIISRIDNNEPVMVIDAKYKPDSRPVRDDSHQLLSYVLLTGVKRCGFIFPGKNTKIKKMESTQACHLLLRADPVRYYELILGNESMSIPFTEFWKIAIKDN